MSDFQQLWSQRLKQHLRQQNKYLRYVFNDHLILALVFVVGALAFWYSNYLATITAPLWWAPALVSVVLLIVLFIGRLATLMVRADQLFLLPRESQFGAYLRHAHRYSLALPIFAMVLASLVLTPFVLRATNLAGVTWLALVLSLFIYKDLELWLELDQVLLSPQAKAVPWRRWLAAVALVSWLLGFYLTPWISLGVAVAADLVWRGTHRQFLASTRLDWRVLIEAEASRQFRLLRFYNLFIDVPEVGGHVVANPLLNHCLAWWTRRQKGTFTYLYQRAFLRRTDYLNIWLRFWVIGMILIAVIQQPAVVAVLFLLFLYLTGYQLLPLYHHFDHNALTQLYPVLLTEREADFRRVLQPLLLLQWLGYSIVLLVTGPQHGWLLVAGLIVAGLALVLLFLRLYLPRRLQMKKRG